MKRSGPEALIARLGARSTLDNEDRNSILSLSFAHREVPAHGYLIREGSRPSRSALLVSGFAYRYRLTAAGGRQILGFMIPGDFVDLHHLFVPDITYTVQALTRVTQADVSTQDLLALVGRRPAIARALTAEALVEHSIACEAIVNVGRRDGPTRLAHLICEFEARLIAAGLSGEGHQLPMTQEQIGDATGLHEVHAHRTIKLLEQEGLIVRSKRTIKIVDWPALQRRAQFDPRYLHL